ncbi:MAG: hypothetical protein ACKOOJ_01590 [Actinomycetota bacterium]|jgi:vacuolar-type H+-ATPase subunit D/Vma8
MTIEEISAIKKRVNEIALAPLPEHGDLFEKINIDLTEQLSSVEGISS